MAKRKKRAPPTYNEKYKDIKASGWKVDIPRPTDARSKALVTKYHRILFGGFTKRNGKRVHTPSLNISYLPYTGKHSQAISDVYKRTGSPRIKNAYYPKELGKVKNASKKSITFESKFGRAKIARVSPRQIREAGLSGENAIRERLNILDKSKNYRLMIGPRMMPQTYDYESLIDRLTEIAEESEEMLNMTEIGEFELI